MKGEAPLISRLTIAQDRTLYDLTEWSLVTGIIDEFGIHQLETHQLISHGAHSFSQCQNELGNFDTEGGKPR
jgi:hypothetical protein